MTTRIFRKIIPTLVFINLFIICIVKFAQAQEDAQEAITPEPIIVNGDTVEYSTESKEFSASGNVVVVYKSTRLTCQNLSLNSETKDCVAQGNARLDDGKGTIEGEKITYNFEKKTGTIFDAEFRSNPYFGKAEKLDKVSDAEFINRWGYMTTCDYDNPHWRMKSRKVNFFPGDKVQLQDNTFYMGKVPLLYLPRYNHSLKDPIMHVQMMAGKSKVWGPYFLSAWRYSLTEDIKGRIFFDYRANRGVAEGFGVNYYSDEFGKGDFKLYYTQERDHTILKTNMANRKFERYFIRLRHQWDIDRMTNVTAEYWKITDSKRATKGIGYNIFKDYFPREYDYDMLPLSYALIHRSFDYSGVDILLQKRINRWYSQAEKLPEIKYSLPNISIGNSPFYFDNRSGYVNYNYKHAVPSPHEDDTTYNQFDTTNKVSYPVKVAFFNLTPSASVGYTYNDNQNGVYHRTAQVVFSAGSDLSTKFYRIFNVKTNFLGLDINDLRHIITPTAAYSYSKASIMQASKASFGGGASAGDSSVALELSNKLQTKRKGQKVDLFDFRVNNTYTIKPKTGTKRGSSFSDFIFKLELLPYSWLSIYGDATYKHTGSHGDKSYKHFSQASYDIGFSFTPERSISLGQRYNRGGSNTITYSLNWRLNPKWKILFYHSINRGNRYVDKRGLREQEYTISRDLHCWTMELNYSVTRGQGEAVWLILRLKAFPEMEFDYNKNYNVPKPGSQSNP